MMSYYMGEKNKQRQAEAWFDQTNDALPFDAFGSEEHKIQTGHEIYARIQLDIRRKRQTLFLYMKVAAAILILVALSIPAFRYMNRPPKQLAWTIIKADTREYKKITLPDSTVINLKSNSSIRFLSAFKERTIYLETGEAFFDVKKNAMRPFTVYAKGFRIKVLGTSFNISAYKDFKIEVVSGKIKIEQDIAPGKVKVLAEELTKDQRLAVNMTTAEYKIDSVITEKASRLTLQQIAKELGDRFNLFVQLNNPGNDTSIYTVVLQNRSLKEILTALSAETGFDYEVINKQHLIIHPKI
jgi:transmembrane sensor